MLCPGLTLYNYTASFIIPALRDRLPSWAVFVHTWATPSRAISPRWPFDIPTHCLSLPCSPSPSHKSPAPTGLDWWPQCRASWERAGIVSWLLASSHPVPTEMHPREWRRSQIGQMDCGWVCSCAVVWVTRLWLLQRTGGAAAGGRLDKRDKGGCQDE